MSRPKIHKRAGFEFYYRQFDVQEGKDFEDLNTPEDREFQREVKADGGIIHDIILSKWEDELYLIDGRRRILASRALLAEGDDDFQHVSGKVFLNVDPENQAIWAIISNEHRSKNPIDYYLKYLDLKKTRDWEEIGVQYRLNKGRMKIFATLDQLEHPDEFIAAHLSGGITFNNLKAVANLAPARQDTLLAKLQDKDKITVTDVKQARRLTQEEVLQSQPSMNLPDTEELAQAPIIEELFMPGDIPAGVWGPVSSWDTAKEVADENDWKIYRLVEV